MLKAFTIFYPHEVLGEESPVGTAELDGSGFGSSWAAALVFLAGAAVLGKVLH